MFEPNSIPELAKLLGFLGNEQRLNILKAISHEEKFAREISEEIGVSRPLVNIYLKQFEKAGLVVGTNRVAQEPPYLKRYYRAVPFELVLNLDLIEKLEGGGR
ncbi:ArsR/SmtB family transcription factor [Methanosphaerula palustris]|uniref:Transcriptional regulator, TrmB n=1 Tax=Methanosphaerula palustris (strain ATCC BAA-1556 / DSM 19958 / E1-9c) TaxID=521011 RepID=B8GKZ3_METPE|nr:winged helix-turn-helix domain-containing protein [Methanosphaerula palustris]ACL17289.1 transcriptional regulator, TrmB [Methanosphaerula palustris E1-9c]